MTKIKLVAILFFIGPFLMADTSQYCDIKRVGRGVNSQKEFVNCPEGVVPEAYQCSERIDESGVREILNKAYATRRKIELSEEEVSQIKNLLEGDEEIFDAISTCECVLGQDENSFIAKYREIMKIRGKWERVKEMKNLCEPEQPFIVTIDGNRILGTYRYNEEKEACDLFAVAGTMQTDKYTPHKRIHLPGALNQSQLWKRAFGHAGLREANFSGMSRDFLNLISSKRDYESSYSSLGGLDCSGSYSQLRERVLINVKNIGRKKLEEQKREEARKAKNNTQEIAEEADPIQKNSSGK